MTNKTPLTELINKKKKSIKSKKYCYVLVNKKSGGMLLEDSKLPIYWNKKVAKNRCLLFESYEVCRILLDNIDQIVKVIK